MRIAVLAGGIGGARFLRGVRAARPDDDITAIVNTGDDVTLHGLRICPDLDSVMYTLGGVHDAERGWGREGESWRIREELAAYGAEPTWFVLGDLDIATHLVRTRMLEAGYSLTDVTAALCQRWQPGVRLLPMTDDRCETHVVVELDGSRKAIHFQEWWVRYRASAAGAGVRAGRPGRRRRDAGGRRGDHRRRRRAVAPSNPVVSIGTILACRRSARRWSTGRRRSSASRPSSAARRCAAWPTRACRPSASRSAREGVGRHYGARSDGGLLDGWLVHETDTAARARRAGALGAADDDDDDATAAMVHAALQLT